MKREKIFDMPFAKVYPLLVAKVEKKGRTQAEVDEVIYWLTGYDQAGLKDVLERKLSYEAFFANAPQMNPSAKKLRGSVCGIKVQEIEDPLMQKIRWLDKLVDDLAKGKKMEKILPEEVNPSAIHLSDTNP